MNAAAANFNRKGTRAMDKGDLNAATKHLRKAVKADPDWAVPWYHLGLVYKHQQKWQKSLECNVRATRLDPMDQAGWWNMGIAATAVEDWAAARKAWKNYGVDVPSGEGPIEMEIGMTPIRINRDSKPEVVWCKRIDPARAIVYNLPLPESNHRYQDLLLHDGEPKGYRRNQGHEVPVFDALKLLKPSDYSTYELIIEANDTADRQALEDLAEERGLGVENWSTIRMICKACSEGRPHDDHEPQEEDGPLVRFGVAAQYEEEVEQLLIEWRVGRSTCLVHEVTCVLDASK